MIPSKRYEPRHTASAVRELHPVRDLVAPPDDDDPVVLRQEIERLQALLADANAFRLDALSLVSHELRSPLNIILGYNEMLVDEAFGPLTEEQRDTLKRVEMQALLLLGQIDETLDFSRLESGRTVVEPADVVVEELLLEVESEARPFIEQRISDVEVSVHSPPVAPVLYTDREKLKVVLKNLLSNALKFTPKGQIDVSAAACVNGVEFAVRDTGIGIPRDELLRIFEPFRQVKGTLASGCRGVGLGLHIAQRFLGLLGGRIEVESAVGEGSTFRVWMPLRTTSAPVVLV